MLSLRVLSQTNRQGVLKTSNWFKQITVTTTTRTTHSGGEDKKKKPAPCSDFEKLKEMKVPNQRLECFPEHRFPYRRSCKDLGSRLNYKPQPSEKSAWAFKPDFQTKDIEFEYDASCRSLPECCENPRLDHTLYKESDKHRRYQKTWLECIRSEPEEIPCPPQYKMPEIVKRKRGERPPTATVQCPKETAKNSSKCPKVPSGGACRDARSPPSCTPQKVPAQCKKRCCPFPSFSECCLSQPLPKPKDNQCDNRNRECVH